MEITPLTAPMPSSSQGCNDSTNSSVPLMKEQSLRRSNGTRRKRRKFPRRICQRPKLSVKRKSTSDEKHVVSDGPGGTKGSILLGKRRKLNVTRVFLSPERRALNRQVLAYATPQSRKTAVVAKRVHQDDGGERAGSEIHECCEPAKDRGVAELNEGAQKRGCPRDVRVG